MTRSTARALSIVALAVAIAACDDDDPTGLRDLDDVAGTTLELVGIGHIYGYHDSAPGTLVTGDCHLQPVLREETEYREGELTFSADEYVLETRVRRHCFDPDDEVIVPQWGPVMTETMAGGWMRDGDRIAFDPPPSLNVYGYLDDGELRVELEPASGPVEQGVVLYFD